MLAVLLSCTLLALAAVGCGDDSGGGAAGEGGAGAGGAGSGGAGGAGSGGAGAGGDIPACMAAQPATVPAACATCVCTNATVEATKCGKNAMCWPLVNCIGAMCANEDRTACATTGKCMPFLAGGLDAQPLTATLTGACASVCTTAPTGDGGTDDGGN